MGWLEKIIVTPSHHRVHHAINPEYMDKNYGQIFIFWDKWFGTFQEEKDDIPPVYGVTRAVKTWNPWIINFKHLWLLVLDFFRTRSWRDKVRIWFMPTGWRPSDVIDRYPVSYTKDIFHRQKYDTDASVSFKAWSGVQLVMTLLFTLHFFWIIGDLSYPDIFLYGVFIFIHVFAYTSLMDGSLLGPIAEMVKVVYIGIILYPVSFDWFGLSGWNPMINTLVLNYFAVSFILTVYFYFYQRPVNTASAHPV
jgi:hypothetical protein